MAKLSENDISYPRIGEKIGPFTKGYKIDQYYFIQTMHK